MFSAWAKEMGFEPAPAAALPDDEIDSSEEKDNEQEEELSSNWDYRPPLFSDTRGFVYEVKHKSWIYSTSSPMSKKLGRRTPGQLVRVFDYNISRSWCRVVTETRHGLESGWMAMEHDTLGPMLEILEEIPQLRPKYDAVDPSPKLPTASSGRGASAPAYNNGDAAYPEQGEPLTAPPKAWKGEDAPLVIAKKPMWSKRENRQRGLERGSEPDDEGAAESKKPIHRRDLGYDGFDRVGDGGLGVDVTSAIWQPKAVIRPVKAAVREALLAEEAAQAAAAAEAAAKAAKEEAEAKQRELKLRAAQAPSDGGLLYEVVSMLPVHVRAEPDMSAKVVTRRVNGQVLEVFDFDQTGTWGLVQFKWKKGVQMGWVLLSSPEGDVLLQPYWLLDGEDRQEVLKR